MKVIATTPDPEIFVVQYEGTLDWQLMLKRHIDDDALRSIRVEKRDWRGRRIYGDHYSIQETENKAWTYTEPDCFAIADDGTEYAMDTNKQIKHFCETGEFQETARARKRREQETFWASVRENSEEDAA